MNHLQHLFSGDSVGLESVGFQSVEFFNELAAIFAEAREFGYTKGEADALSKRFGEIVWKYTRITMALEVEPADWINAYAFIYPLHVEDYAKEYMRPVGRKGAKSSADIRSTFAGHVNQNTGHVGGIFTKLKTVVGTSRGTIYGSELTPEEVAGVMLHEIGHVYTTMFLATCYTHGMQAYRQAMDQFRDVTALSERRVILKLATKAAGREATDEEINAALDADYKANKTGGTDNDWPAVGTLMIRTCQETFEFGAGKAREYSGRVFEQMADEYAIRYGAGKHLASGLSKVMGSQFSIRKGPSGVAGRAGTMLAAALSIGMAVTPGGAAAGILGLFLITLTTIIEAGLGSNVYDTPRTRYDKMLQQLAIRAKTGNTKLSRDAVKEEYDVIKSARDLFVDTPPYLVQAVTKIVPPFARRARFSAAIGELEKLASSELYIQNEILSKK